MRLIFLPSGLNPVWSGAVESNNTASAPWFSWEHLHIRSTDEQVDRERERSVSGRKLMGYKWARGTATLKFRSTWATATNVRVKRFVGLWKERELIEAACWKLQTPSGFPSTSPLLWQNSTEAVVEIDITTGSTYRHTDWITKIFSKHIFRLKNTRPLPLLVPLD